MFPYKTRETFYDLIYKYIQLSGCLRTKFRNVPCKTRNIFPKTKKEKKKRKNVYRNSNTLASNKTCLSCSLVRTMLAQRRVIAVPCNFCWFLRARRDEDSRSQGRGRRLFASPPSVSPAFCLFIPSAFSLIFTLCSFYDSTT